ncbi:MAG: hypothetical protein ABR576_15755 [Thermoanaerobaculia bacterium]
MHSGMVSAWSAFRRHGAEAVLHIGVASRRVLRMALSLLRALGLFHLSAAMPGMRRLASGRGRERAMAVRLCGHRLAFLLCLAKGSRAAAGDRPFRSASEGERGDQSGCQNGCQDRESENRDTFIDSHRISSPKKVRSARPARAERRIGF